MKRPNFSGNHLPGYLPVYFSRQIYIVVSGDGDAYFYIKWLLGNASTQQEGRRVDPQEMPLPWVGHHDTTWRQLLHTYVSDSSPVVNSNDGYLPCSNEHVNRYSYRGRQAKAHALFCIGRFTYRTVTLHLCQSVY